jgi:glucokinase
MATKHYIGVDLGGTNIKAGVVTENAQVVVKTVLATEADKGADHIIDRICRAVKTLMSESGLSREDIGGIGVGSPGTLDTKAGVVHYAPNMPLWADVNVVERVYERTGMKTVLENDANAAAYGEFWAGAGKGVSSIVMFTLGTGIGGGIIANGRLIHGTTDCAGELGHMTIEVEGRECACGNHGCLEAYASANSLARRFKEAVAAGGESVLSARLAGGGQVDSRAVCDAALAGDELALRIFWETGVYLGVGIVNIMHTINPARVIISGGLIKAGDLLMRPIKDTVERRALPDAKRNCDIVFASLGEDAGFIGGAGCALAAFGISQ